MSKESERVLEMVADGTITAAEGAKLLEALGSTRGHNSGRTARKGRTINTKSIISEIGPMIQSTIGDVLGGKRNFENFNDYDLKQVNSIEEEVTDKTTLIVHGIIKNGNSISIMLLRSTDNKLRASVEQGSSIQTGVKGTKKIIVCNFGDLVVEVPDNINDVKVFSKGGGITSRGINAPISLKTMGGGVSVYKPRDSFSIKTMGGGLDITLDKDLKANSKAKTMGGGIAVHISEGMAIQINASTFGGSIDFDKNHVTVLSESGKSNGKAKVSLKYGNQKKPAILSVVSMGGGIEINEIEDIDE